MARRTCAVALTAALALTACDGGPPAQDRLTPVAAVQGVAAATAEAGTSKIALTSSSSIQGQPFELSGSGVVDHTTGEGQLSFSLPAGGQELTIETRVVDRVVYVKVPMQESFFKLDLEDIAGTSLGGSADPTAQFDALKAAGDVTTVGEEDVRGTATTHYKGSFDVDDALAAADAKTRPLLEKTLGSLAVTTVPFDVWIDDQGRMRKLVQVVAVTVEQQSVEATTTVELFDYGTPVDLQAPPADQVQDGAPLLEGLGATG